MDEATAAELAADEERNLEKQRAARRALKPGEWACLDAKCSHINQEFRNTCEKCGKPKARAKTKIGREIGKDAAEKSKGLFAAEDWACTKCGNINWARRTTCNICNAPKLGDLERRTGYGGGYMDREDVEYIDREDDDDFDEFGRKKKRKGANEDGSTDQPQHEHAAGDTENTLTAAADEEEHDDEDKEQDDSGDDATLDKYKLDDDEDDDDDANLDKYDLTADPEVAVLKATNNGTAKTDGNGRDGGDRPGSRASSDCSCSCSGGECSCEESDDGRVERELRSDDRSDKERSDRDRRRKRSRSISRSRSPRRHRDDGRRQRR